MKTKTFRWLAGAGVGVGVATIAASFASCSESAPECQVGADYLPYVAQLTVKGQMPACAAANPIFAQGGEQFAMEFYHPPTADGTTYDDSKTTMAVKSNFMGTQQLAYSTMMYADGTCAAPDPVLAGADSGVPYALGPFASPTPDSNDLCHANPAPASESFGAVPAGAQPCNAPDAGVPSPPLPAISVSESWSNLQIYVTAAVQGDQFNGDFTRTVNGCTVSYHAVGLWPGVPCTGADAMGNAIPDIQQCSPCPNADAGMAYGSGINPNFPISCKQLFDANDPLGRPPFWCVLSGSGDATGSSELPQLNSEEPPCAVSM